MRHMTRAFLIGKKYIIAERYVNYCFINHPYLWDESNFMKMVKKLRIMKGDKLRKHCQIFCPENGITALLVIFENGTKDV